MSQAADTFDEKRPNIAETDGVEAATLSMRNLEDRQPEVLLPSHGSPMMDGPAALRETRTRRPRTSTDFRWSRRSSRVRSSG